MTQSRKILLEACVDSVEAAISLQNAGADRLEVCSFLPSGGLTPSAGFLRQLQQHLTIPYHILVRPREGDFTYSTVEKETILSDIQMAKDTGADGVVFGALLEDGGVDVAFMEEVIREARPLRITFNRAFDLVPNPFLALEKLMALDVGFILTSGQEEDSLAGANLLRQLQEKAEGHLTILAGGGISAGNVAQLLQATQLSEIHFSALEKTDSPMAANNNLILSGANNPKEDLMYRTGAPEKLFAIRDALVKAGYELTNSPISSRL